MTQKEQIASLEQRVQALESQLRKVVRTERNEQSSGTVKPLPNRRQDRLAKLDSNAYTEGKGGVIGSGPEYKGDAVKFDIKAAWPIELKKGGEGEVIL